jgi:hypothetical protein
MMSFLKVLFAAIFFSMVGITVRASLDRSVIQAFFEIARDPWGLATLADAYFGFLTFYVWVAYKERGLVGRGAWLVLILLFGNLAMSAYVLLELFRLPPGAPVESLLLRRPAA